MRNKTSIVTSAADVCGKPSSIRPMDNSPSRDHKGAEYKESFMFSNRSSVSHGCSLAAAAVLAAVACIGLAGTASASTIIYLDSFSGSSAANSLNGAAPTVDNGTSSTWTAGSTPGYNGFTDTGSASTSTGNGIIAYLNFLPSHGYVYTLSVGMQTTSANAWLALGFMTSPMTNNRFDQPDSSGGPGATPWALVHAPPSSGTYIGSLFTGPAATVYGQNFSPPAGVSITGTQNISIILNTGSSAWTYQVFDNGTAVSPVEGFHNPNPAIVAVGLNTIAPSGQFSNFELSSAAVPEPATLGLVAVGGLGLLLLKRRKTV